MANKYSKIVKILSHSQPSYHGTVTYHVQLNCGHVAIRDYNKRIEPIGKRTICRLCNKIDDFDKYKK